ncbi:MAG: iron-containing alcohol dehydrogenase family protein [Lachnospiraceae bacterium]|nr:iron-containing alcohol dehydrogenase family protein [Lachnospiraceae bacterium]MDE6253288.1 iron-containing alcohol dehydrogenase family protein [Lachnospiraceae bacterium]
MIKMNRFRLPYCMTVEEGIFERVDEVISGYIPGINMQKAIIVTEENLKNIFPDCLDEILRDFKNSEVFLVDKSSYDDAVDLGKYICMNDIQVVIGFGGGMVLDMAKFAAFISKTTYISLPTTLSNDSIASPFAVLGTDDGTRKTFGCKIPSCIIVDVDVIMNTPEGQLKSGIGDTVSKYTALYDWKLSCAAKNTKLDDFAYMISEMALNSVCYHENKSLKSKSFIRTLTEALVMGGLAMEIAGSSRPSSGSEHLFCHSLEENHKEIKISHGIAVAMGSVAASIFQGRDEKKLVNILNAYDIDYNPMNYGITKGIFIDAWQRAEATRKNRITILSETVLNSEWLSEIYDRMTDKELYKI